MADDIYTKLYDRLFAEQEKYVDWLLSQPRIEIMRQSYEFAMREDILMIFENAELEPEHAKALYDKGSPWKICSINSKASRPTTCKQFGI